MKKEFKEKLIGVVLVVLGVLCIFAVCVRAEQINNSEVSYERVN